MSVQQPQPHHLTLIDQLEASTVIGDRELEIASLHFPTIHLLLLAVDALIVGIQTQAQALGNKATWTRKMVLLTDGENPIELEDDSLEGTIDKIKELNIHLSIMFVPLVVP